MLISSASRNGSTALEKYFKTIDKQISIKIYKKPKKTEIKNLFYLIPAGIAKPPDCTCHCIYNHPLNPSTSTHGFSSPFALHPGVLHISSTSRMLCMAPSALLTCPNANLVLILTCAPSSSRE